MLRRTFPAIFALALVAGTGAAEPSNHWLHVKVDQITPEKQTVRINLPVRLVSEILPLVKEAEFDRGLVRLDHVGYQQDIDLRAILAAVRGAEDGEYLTVDGPDETVRVTKKNGLLLIKVDQRAPEPQTVDIKVRMEVLDALLSAPPGQLNVSAAVDVIGSDEAELITVNEADQTVRIWVDTKPTAD